MASKLVLDTNVALDALAFRDPRCAPLVAALEAREIVWFASAHMRRELELVLDYPGLRRYAWQADAVLGAFDQLVARHDAALASPPPLRCRDASDQMFIDLALAVGARWLLSRDRDLLALARRARVLGLRITVPERWAAEQVLANTADPEA